MFWKLGWFLDSLNFQVEKQLHAWRKSNNVLKANQWKGIEKVILLCAKSPLLSSIGIFVFMLFVALSLTICYPNLTKYLPEFNQTILLNFNEWDSTLVASCVAMISLIVPLALGFVSNTIKDSSSKDAFWEIYLNYAAPKFIVTSTFFMIIFSLSSQYFKPFVGTKMCVSLSACIILWMLLNCFLMIWFFFATFKLVSFDSRNYLTYRYCINEELIKELKIRLSRLIPQNAISLKIIPDFESKKTESNISSFKISTIKSFVDEYQDFNRLYKEPKYIKNIYFRILAINIHLIYLHILIENKIKAFLKKDINKTFELCLPLTGGSGSSQEISFVHYYGFKLNMVEKLIFNFAYPTQKGNEKKESNLKIIISMLSGQVRDAIREDNYQHYKIALEAFENLAKKLIEGSHFINDEGSPDNWLLLVDGSFFSDKLLWVISKEFFELTNETLELLTKSNKYFYNILHSQLSIAGYRKSEIADEVSNNLLNNHYRQWKQLIEWRNQFESHDKEFYLNNIYESAVRSYVSSWEAWSGYSGRINKTKWTNVSTIANFFAEHLDNTACMLINSLRNKESISASWAADMIIHWIDDTFVGQIPYKYNWRSQFLTLSELGKEENDKHLSFVLKGDTLEENISEGLPNQHEDAIKIAISNYWSDVILLTSAYILQRPIDEFTDKAVELALNLVNEERPHPSTHAVLKYLRLDKGSIFVSAFLRQNFMEGWRDSKYSKRLQNLLSRFNSLDEAPKVSGRVYTGWGKNLKGGLAGLKALFLFKSNGNFQFNKDTQDFIFEMAEFEKRKWIIRELNSLKEIDAEPFTKLIGIENYAEKNDKFCSQIDSCIEEIEKATRVDLEYAQVDPEREKELSKFASNKAFNPEKSSFPTNQFGHPILCEDRLPEYSISFSNYNKSEVAKGIEAQRSINEDDWLASTIDNGLNFNIMASFWENNSERNQQRFNDWASLLQSLKSTLSSYSNNANPVFIVSQFDLQWYLERILWGYDKKIQHPEFDCRREDGMGDSYICHFESIEVHSGPIKNIPNILTSKDVFIELKANKSDNGFWVQAKYEEDPENEDPNIGKLILTYWMEPIFGDDEVFLFQGQVEENDD